MYAYIKGTFVSARGDNIVIENNGIGYKIYMPLMLQGRIGHIGDEVCVYTYHYVREDLIALYGFPEPEDQDMFELLLTVSGVGPKSALRSFVRQNLPLLFFRVISRRSAR